MKVLIVAMTLTLAACKTCPLPEVVKVQVDRYVAIPAELTRDCEVYTAKRQDYQEAKDLALKRRESLLQCNRDKAKIRALGQ